MKSSPLRSSKLTTVKSRSTSTISASIAAAPNQVGVLQIVDYSQHPTPVRPVAVSDLRSYVEEWLGDCEWRNNSPATIATNETMLRNFLWWLDDNTHLMLTAVELRAFFLYVKNGHTDTRGRWGDPQLVRPVSSRTVKDYYCRLRVFLRWSVKQGYIKENPLEKLSIPVHRADQIQPFSKDQFDALLAAARRTNKFQSRGTAVEWEVSVAQQCALRDETILWTLYDTGLRATELCNLTRTDLDMKTKNVRVMTGKGGKARTVYFGRVLTSKLWRYLHGMAEFRKCQIEDGAPLFQSQVGPNRYGKLNKDSLGAIFERLEDAAGIHGVRCSPHTMRHTHAIEYLRAGGSLSDLMERLGHTSMDMTRRYVAFADADLQGQSRHSPADAHGRKVKGK